MDRLPSCKSILLLGEGNFSFARSLCETLESAPGRAIGAVVVATSFEAEKEVRARRNGCQNTEALTGKGVSCLFDIDATKVDDCQALGGRTFDAVVFNFPHTPGKANIARNRQLLKDFFKYCTSKMTLSGCVLVTLCNGQGGTPADSPQRQHQNSWQVVAMATYGDLILTEVAPFQAEAYKKYDATGYRGQDKGFLTKGAVTHVFERSPPISPSPDTEPGEPLAARHGAGLPVEYACPSDLGMYMKRDLLCNGTHPLGLLKEAFISKIQELLPGTREVPPGDSPIVVTHGEEKFTACSGVYRLPNVRDESPVLRPHLLCLGDDYAGEGCVVLAGRSYHRCRIEAESFPITHSLLLLLPGQEASPVVTATTLLDNLYGERPEVEIFIGAAGNVQRNGKAAGVVESGSLMSSTKTESVCTAEKAAKKKMSTKRKLGDCTGQDRQVGGQHSSSLDTGTGHCDDCLRGWVSDVRPVWVKDGSSDNGKTTLVGLCGTTASRTAPRRFILVYLDGLLMDLLHILDIRLLWSTDPQVWAAFKRSLASHVKCGKTRTFGADFRLFPRSIHPPVYIRDVSFWVPGDFDELVFMSVLRRGAGLLLRRAWLKGVYRDEVRGDSSRCYRLEYTSCDAALSKEAVGEVHGRILELISEEMGLTAR